MLKASWLLLLFPFILGLIDLEFKNFWIFLLVILLPLSFLQKAIVIYEDYNVTYLKKTIDLKYLYPIKTNEIRYSYLKSIDKEVEKLKENNVKVFFYGNFSHLFHYLYPSSSLNIKSFRQPVDTLIFFKEIDNTISKDDPSALFLINSYPESITDGYLSLFEKELIKSGFQRIEENSIIYYLK